MGKTLLLLHGALGSQAQLEPVKVSLSGKFNVHSFNFIGHGGSAIPDSIHINDLVDQLHQYIKENISKEDELTLFGYSMGGYAALLLASKNICRIDRIFTLGTKLNWDIPIAERETKMLDPETIEQKVPSFAEELKQRHHPADWKLLLKQTAGLMKDLGANQYLNDETFAKITTLCRLMIGDGDKMVSLDETQYAAKKIPGASFLVLPSTPHPIEKVIIEQLVSELIN